MRFSHQSIMTGLSLVLLSCSGKFNADIGNGGLQTENGPVVISVVIDEVTDEILITGTGLDSVTDVTVRDPGMTDHDFTIDSQTATTIIANAVNPLVFTGGLIYELILPSAYGAGGANLTITLADSSVTAAKLAQSGATTNQVLVWDGSAWTPTDPHWAPDGSGNINRTSGKVGIQQPTPQTRLDVNGDVKLGNEGQACSAQREGSMRYNSTRKAVEVCLDLGGSYVWDAIVNTPLGTIQLYAGVTAPDGWAFCNGQLQAIATYPDLYAVLGTTYGGDGITTFALPDLRSRVVVGAGTGMGLSAYSLGQTGGLENQTLLTANMPSHSHTITVTSSLAASTGGASAQVVPDPSHVIRTDTSGGSIFEADAPDTTLGGLNVTATASSSGGGTAFSIIQPYNTLNYIIRIR